MGGQMSQDKGSTRADTLVKVILVFFISLLSFSVGTFVGKQVSDSDHRRLALEGGDHDTQAAAEHEGDHHAAKDSSAISDEEVAHLTEEFVNKEKAQSDREPASADSAHGHPAEVPDRTAANDAPASDESSGYKKYPRKEDAHAAKDEQKAPAAEHAAPAAHDEKATAHGAKKEKHVAAPAGHAAAADKTHDVAAKVASGHAPTDGHKEVRKPAAVLPSVATGAIGKFTVQVASYADETVARSHAAELKGKGWSAFYLSAQVSGRTWYRVVVGLFDDSQSAKAFKDKLMTEAKVTSAIVQKIVK